MIISFLVCACFHFHFNYYLLADLKLISHFFLWQFRIYTSEDKRIGVAIYVIHLKMQPKMGEIQRFLCKQCLEDKCSHFSLLIPIKRPWRIIIINTNTNKKSSSSLSSSCVRDTNYTANRIQMCFDSYDEEQKKKKITRNTKRMKKTVAAKSAIEFPSS